MEERSGKRKSSQIGGPSKRSRISSTEQSQSRSATSARAGIIKKITLLNFMCHSALEIDLSPRVNFVTGRNGSGKSAILTALVIGLGGKAVDTNRGSSLKELIKVNENSATIRVILNNEGYNAYHPEIFGHEITIQRTINLHSGNQCKIMASDGHVVSNKHEDLARMTSSLNLQVDNPVAILTQDTARTFLHNTKPSDKYMFFLKATRLEHIESVYKRVQEGLQLSIETQELRAKVLEDLMKKKTELEKRLINLQSIEKSKDRLEACQNELYWSQVAVKENKLKEVQSTVNEYEKSHTRLEAEISKAEKAVKLISDNKKEFEVKAKDLQEESSRLTAKGQECKKAAEIMNNKYKDKAEEVQSKFEDIKRLKSNIQKLNAQIMEMQAAIEKKGHTDVDKRDKAIAELNTDEESLAAQIKTNQHHLTQLESAVAQDRNTLQSLGEEHRELKHKIARIKSKLVSLDDKQDGLLKLFGNYVIPLNKLIKKYYEQGAFSAMPIGPLGMYIKVKDKSWAPSVESLIGKNNLRSYYVNSHEDRKLLYKLMEQVIKNEPCPPINAGKFSSQMYDYKRKAVEHPHFSNALEMLEVDNYLVVNCLIDLVALETTLLVDSPKVARELMEKQANVPQHCKKVMTKAGDTVLPDPFYRWYSGDDRTEAKFLQVSLEEAKTRLNREIADCNGWMSNTSSQSTEVEKRIESHKVEIERTKKLLSTLNTKKLKIVKQLNELQETEIASTDNIEIWMEEKSSLEDLLQRKEQQLSEAKSEYNNLKIAVKGLADDYMKHKEKSKEKTRELDSLVSTSNNMDNKLRAWNSKIESYSKRKAEYEQNLAQSTSKALDLTKVIEKMVADGLELTGERIFTTRSETEIQEDMAELRNTIERVERMEGDPKVVFEEFIRIKEKYKNSLLLKEALDMSISRLEEMLKQRRTAYSRCLKLLTSRIKLVFHSLINSWKFQGEIIVDHSEHTLDIKVKLKDTPAAPTIDLRVGKKRPASTIGSSDPKSLSGGERSFSTVAFILSLWDAVELPFYALDEFDVFMDNLNRENTLNLLMRHTEEKKEYQYIFLTPQTLNSVKSMEKASIFSLQAHAAQRQANFLM